MNPPDDLPEDELVSAVLDGEADDAMRAQVAADPTLHTRLATFAGLRADLHDVVIPTDLLDALRLTVLDATAPATPVPRTAPVFDLSARRARRSKAAGWISAAAAAVVLIAAIGLTGRDGDDGSSGDASMTAAFGTGSTGSRESATEAADSRGNAAGATPGLAAGIRPSGAGASTGSKASTGATAAPSAPPRDLGPVVDLDALISTYRSGTSSVPTTTVSTTASTTGASCGPAIAVAVLGGRPVQLVANGTQVLVVDRSTCVVVGSFVP